MTAKAIRQKALALTVTERLSLVQDLWDSIAEDGLPPLSEEEKRVLDERVAEYRRNPRAGAPWSVVKRRVLKAMKSPVRRKSWRAASSLSPKPRRS